MSDELTWTNSEGKLAKATGRVLVGNNQYATMVVSCHIRTNQASTGDDIEQLGEHYLTAASTYALGLGRALAERGTPPDRLEVDADCKLDRTGDEPRLSGLALEVRGEVHGCDQQTFEAAAADAGLLQAAWALPATAAVRLAALLDAEIDTQPRATSDAPAEVLTAAPAPPSARPGARLLLRLVLLALLSGAVLVYLAIGTPAQGTFGIVRARLLQQLGLGSAGASAAPPTRIAPDAGAATSPTAEAAGIQQPAATPSPVAVQAAVPSPSPLIQPARQPSIPPGTPVPTVVASAPSIVAAAPSVIAQASAGPGFFEETFANNQRHWPDDPGSTAWLASDGYRLTPRRATQFVALRAPLTASFRDVMVTGVFRKVAGPPGGGYGLILRDQSPTPLDGIIQTGRYYVFEVGDRDGVGIWRREGDSWIDILPWSPSTAVHGQEGTNELVAEAHGTRLDFLVNGTPVASEEDAVLAEGSVGVFAGGDGNDVLLTRFAVQPLS